MWHLGTRGAGRGATVAIITRLGLLTALGACATGTGQLGVRPQGPSSEVLTVRELRGAVIDGSAYDAIRATRPLFLTMHGVSSLQQRGPGGPDVYIDGMMVGGVALLHELPARDLREVRYYDAWSAGVAFGPGHPDGVIAIRTMP